MPTKLPVLFFLFLFALCMNSTSYANNGVGQVISIKPGGFAQRGSDTLTLALNTRVNERDSVRTDASGRVQIILDDDTTLSLAPSTQLTLDRVVADGRNPEFRASTAGGLVRFITGKIAERNPGAFTVSTPRGTVGIRGTIFSVRCDDKTVTVYVTNTTHGGVEVAGQTVPSGSKMILRDDGLPVIVPMTAEESDAIDRQVASGIASGSIVADGEATTTEGEEEKTFTVADKETSTGLADLQNSMNNSLQPSNMYQPLQTGMAMYAGMEANITGGISISSVEHGLYDNMAFSLNLDLFSGLGSGQIQMTGTSGGNPMNMSGNIFLWTTAHTMNIDGSVNDGTLSISGNVLNVQNIVTQIDFADGISPQEQQSVNSIDAGSLHLSASANIVGNTQNILVSNGRGSYSFTFDATQAAGISGLSSRINLSQAFNNGSTVSAPVTAIEGSGPVTPKP